MLSLVEIGRVVLEKIEVKIGKVYRRMDGQMEGQTYVSNYSIDISFV